MKLQQDLKQWGGLNLNAVTDEDIGDISLAIIYNDHGDDFLYIRTYSGEEYEYGYWLNRKNFWGSFDPAKNDGQSDKWFIKRPILYRMPDENAHYSNEACWIISRNLEKKEGMFGFKTIKKLESKALAERSIEWAIKELKVLLADADEKNIYYSMKGHSAINNLVYFATVNELDQVYFDKIKEVNIDSSINGYDGIAGKRTADNFIFCDHIRQVFYRGKNFDVEKLCISHDSTDEWGCETIRFNTKSLM